MSYVMPYILLVAGFVILIKGADFFVDGSCSIAKKLKIPDIIVGLTIVAMGTSAPELAVSVSAAIGGSSDIAIGNVVGSSLLNILIILGLSSLIVPINVDGSMFKRDIPFLLLTAALLPAVTVIFGMKIGRIAGLVFLLLFAFYIMLNVRAALEYRQKDKSSGVDDGEGLKVMPWWKSLLFTLGGAIMVVIGGSFSVDGATEIAHQLGISEAIIGLTVVAIGTSLPELVTSVVAAKKGNSDIALGNIVGSNIFNVLLILGATAIIKPVSVDMNSLVDQGVLLAVSVILAIAAKTGKKLSRLEGAGFLMIYVVYAVFLFLRG